MKRALFLAIFLIILGAFGSMGLAELAHAQVQDIDATIARQLLNLAWGAVLILMGGMGAMIGIVWAMLNRRIAKGEEQNKTAFELIGAKADAGAVLQVLAGVGKLDDRFRGHEKDDVDRYERMSALISNGQQAIISGLQNIVVEMSKRP